ncbi:MULTISPECIES: aspartate carbamoyltransferase regulatory subunit [Clostridium]|uniref:Aspartate carbamoyltransferase regulatory chain n=4 Tax=Clostridium TaxID=1485 RepID=D8GT14_CLOLD|nr:MULTISPECIES: aspartate carbamoyltransferase regulatory subunit [Clostridium]ADK16613.1 aspartate carbamoyltransferase regulatory chain [Clostridium ljungdahlii DSM 13528]AGY75705.1 aspartate carbamoyltransferase regulatory subunit [Clostridium autoethanogenum DSM 10061]ALU35869.1 Aspartate carbamoyltransferase regulatory subunit [Clostridium autoethanogenum DSM 10061]OAA89517.1 Aspartate carbamoyltransferase regulatory chain [Clostridium ljungdahlii DSM 13528]OAA92678.1 Aspartate carbamoyl
MLTINSVKNGIVIDHIRAGYGMKIFNYLELNKAKYSVALIMNAVSEKLGRKDIIKIENNLELDFTVLGFIDPNITIDIIKDEKIYKKIKLKLPDKIENIIECKNPRCVTSVEKNIPHIFNLVDEKTGAYRCEYCDQIYENLSKYL